MEFANVGAHCADPTCRQKGEQSITSVVYNRVLCNDARDKCADFLPFTCDACTRVFCLDHRSYLSHKCTAAAGRGAETCSLQLVAFVMRPRQALRADHRAIVCPLCGVTVRFTDAQDVNVVFDAHLQTDCKPTGKAPRPGGVPRCPVPGCKAKLLLSNRETCRTCTRTHCLEHRYPDAHNCGARSTATSSAGVSGFLSGFMSRPSNTAPSAPAHTRAPTHTPSHASTRADRDGGKARESGVDALRRTAATRGAAPAPPSTGRELCPVCGDAFTDAVALVTHVEARHGGNTAAIASDRTRRNEGVAAPPPRGGTEVCPSCGAAFPDLIELISHAEAAHASAAASAPAAPTPSRSITAGDDGRQCHLM